MSCWLNPKFRRTPATSAGYAWLQARDFILSNPWGFRLRKRRCAARAWIIGTNVTSIYGRSFEVLRGAVGRTRRFLFLTTKAKRAYWSEEFKDDDHLVFGRETKGLPESLLAANPEHCLTIPMRQEARSLNLATAAGIVLYEAVRQLRAL